MNIKILGTGCTKCTQLENNTKKAIAIIGGFHSITKVDDIVEIMKYNVINTPAIVVDEVVKSTGKLLDVNEIVELLNLK
jgi:small redox-active disulfide protein 2